MDTEDLEMHDMTKERQEERRKGKLASIGIVSSITYRILVITPHNTKVTYPTYAFHPKGILS